MTDPRARRTDALLRDTLIALLEEHRFAEITVGKIVQRAQVNRATFYRHYQDKYDLAAQVIEAAFEDLMADLQASDIENERIDLGQRHAAWTKLFQHVAEHARLYRALLGKTRDPWVMMRMRKSGETWVQQRLQAMHPSRDADDMPEDVAIAFAIELLLGVIGWWLEGNMQYSPDQIATWFIRFISLGYFHAFGLEVKD